MVFNDSSSEDAVVQEVWRICGASANTYSLKAITARVNSALDRFYAIALMEDADWQFDDPNQTTLPIATTNLVSGQYDYTFASEFLIVSKAFVKDSAGNWTELALIDQADPASRNLFLQPSGNSGIPNKYDVMGNSILIDPIPNYNSTSGLKVIFERTASRMASTDTTKVPGVPSVFHSYLCRYASLPFLIEKKLPQMQAVSQQINVDEQAIVDFMANRNKGRRTKFETKYRSSR